MTLYDFKQLAKKKAKECNAKAEAYDIWLSYLTPVNVLMLTGAALLSLVAGSSLLIEASFISKVQAGLMALLSGGLTIIHKTMNCDRHQEECRKLRGSYEAIAEQFLHLEMDDNLASVQSKIDDLNQRLAILKENFSARPPLWVTSKVKKRAKNRLQ